MKKKARPLSYPRIKWFRLAQRIEFEDKLAFYKKIGYTPHSGQIPFHKSTARFRNPCCGRRFGKTTMCIPEGLHVCAMGGWTMVAGPGYKTTDIDFREVMKYVDNPKSGLASIVVNVNRAKGDQEVQFTTGGRLLVRTTENPTSLLGEGIDYLDFDEAAEESDPLVWEENLRPTLLDTGGSAVFPSTPEGDDWYKDMFDKGQNPHDNPEYESWQFTSYDNPYLDLEILQAEMMDMTPEIYEQEIMAQFRSATGAIFRGYNEVATLEMLDRPIPGRQYVMGLDLAKSQDWTVITVMDAYTGDVVYVERFNQLGYKVQVPRIKDIAWRWQTPIHFDQTGVGNAVAEELQEQIDFVPIEGHIFTNLTKASMVNQFAIAIQNDEVHLLSKKVMDLHEPDRPLGRVILGEIGSFKYERTPAGNLKMQAASGKHDDCVTSHILAYDMARRYSGMGPIVPRGANEDRAPVASVSAKQSIIESGPGVSMRKPVTRIGRR
jgi:hypothetical protein